MAAVFIAQKYEQFKKVWASDKKTYPFKAFKMNLDMSRESTV